MLYYTDNAGIEMIKNDNFSNARILITDKYHASSPMVNAIKVIDTSKINIEMVGLITKCNNIKLIDDYIIK